MHHVLGSKRLFLPFIGIMAALLGALAWTALLAAPQPPMVVGGSVLVAGQPAPDGTTVEARVGSTVISICKVGQSQVSCVTSGGKYGQAPSPYQFQVLADDLETPAVEGATEGSAVLFFVNGTKASITLVQGNTSQLVPSLTFHSGVSRVVNLGIFSPVTAHDQTVSTAEDTPLDIVLSATDPDGEALTFTPGVPTHGSLLGFGNRWTYIPNANFNGLDSFTFTATDTHSNSNVATVTINVTPVNDAPVAVNDTHSTSEDTALTVSAPGLLLNDADVDGQLPTVALGSVVGPTKGALAINANGSFTYTPNANANGTDSFTYQATDGALTSNTATVTIAVTAVNDAPVAVNDTYSTVEDVSLVVNAANGVLKNDTDVDSTALSVVLPVATAPQHGTLTLNADGSFTYAPASNYNGPDSFAYQVTDGSATSTTATVSITVNAVNDPPQTQGQSLKTNVDTPLEITLAATDLDGCPLSFAIGTGPTQGTLGALTGLACNGGVASVKVTYTPNAAFTGLDSFTYTVSDGTATASGVVQIGVGVDNVPPAADNQNYQTAEDTSVPVTLSGDDAESAALTFTVVTNPTHGNLTGTGAALTYTPAADFNGTDSFTYKANDGTLDSNIATVTITVLAINDAPSFDAIANQTVNEDAGTQSVGITGVRPGPATATDEATQTVAFTATSSNPSIVPNPTVTGTGATRTLSYTPAANANGTVTITVTADDGQPTINLFPRTFTITVTAVNDAPSLDAISNQTVDEDAGTQTVQITGVAPGPATATDEAGQSVLLAALSNNTDIIPDPIISGTGATRVLSYTPRADAHGTVTITVTANDGQAANNTASRTFTITVSPKNDAPVAFAQNKNTTVNTPVMITLTASDIDGNCLTFVLPGVGRPDLAAPLHGALGALTAATCTSAQVQYTPASGFTGSDAFTFKVNDGSLDSLVVTVGITVTTTPANTVPVASPDIYSTNEDTQLIVPGAAKPGLLANDSDGDNNPLTVVTTSIIGPTHGTLSAVTAQGGFTYTPDANFNGADSFTYVVTDGAAQSARAIVTINVAPVNDAPTFNVINDRSVTQGTTAVTVTITGIRGGPATATDEAGQLVTLTASSTNNSVTAQMSSVGTVVNGTASFTFVPVTVGTATVTVTANDGLLTFTRTFTVTVNASAQPTPTATAVPGPGPGPQPTATVTPSNTAPVAAAGAVSTSRSTPVTITLSATDTQTCELTFEIVTNPGAGSLGGIVPQACVPGAALNSDSATVTYVPRGTFVGTDSFSYRASDGSLFGAAATVVITVNAPPPPPAGTVKAAVTKENNVNAATTVVKDSLGNIVTLSGDALRIEAKTTGAGNRIVLPVNLTQGGKIESFEDTTTGIKIVKGADGKFTAEIPVARDASGKVLLKIVADLDGAPTNDGTDTSAGITRMRLVSEETQQDLSALDATLGNVGFRFDADLRDLPEGATLSAELKGTLPEDDKTAFFALAGTSGLDIKEFGPVLVITKTNLQNGRDIGEARLTMRVSAAWIAKQGGPGNVRMLRRSDEGDTEVLVTTCVGPDAENNFTCTAISPRGFSTFVLAAASQTAPTPTPTPTRTPTPTPTRTPVVAATATPTRTPAGTPTATPSVPATPQPTATGAAVTPTAAVATATPVVTTTPTVSPLPTATVGGGPTPGPGIPPLVIAAVVVVILMAAAGVAVLLRRRGAV